MNSPCVNCGADIRVCKECDWYNGVWISKDQYEARLKADMVAMLKELKTEIEECIEDTENYSDYNAGLKQGIYAIQQKIDKLKDNSHE